MSEHNFWRSLQKENYRTVGDLKQPPKERESNVTLLTGLLVVIIALDLSSPYRPVTQHSSVQLSLSKDGT